MSRQVNNSRRRNGRTRKNTVSKLNPPSTALRYTGPLRPPQEELITTQLVFDTDLTSNAAGVINNLFTDTPSASPDWASLVAVFSEYRTLAMTIMFNPTVTGATIGTLNYNVLYIVWVAAGSDTTLLTSYSQAVNYVVNKVVSLNQPTSLTHKMTGVEESTFVDVTSSVVDYNYKLYADSLTASTRYGHITIKWMVQFRGRR